MLDSLVAHTIVGDEALEREWRSAKRVRRCATGAQETSSALAGAITPSAKAPAGPDLEVPAAT